MTKFSKCKKITNIDNINFINKIFNILEGKTKDTIGMPGLKGIFIFKSKSPKQCCELIISAADEGMYESYKIKGNDFNLGFVSSPCDCFNFAPCIGFADSRKDALGYFNEISL
jgi:hypothetical protein